MAMNPPDLDAILALAQSPGIEWARAVTEIPALVAYCRELERQRDDLADLVTQQNEALDARS